MLSGWAISLEFVGPGAEEVGIVQRPIRVPRSGPAFRVPLVPYAYKYAIKNALKKKESFATRACHDARPP